MYKIGEFARLAGVSVRLLRHYDEIDLIKPAFVDGDSSYRYYTVEQLTRLTHILALKDLGFSLNEIRVMGDVKSLDIERLLLVKRADLLQRIAADQRTLENVERRLTLVRGGQADCDVRTKQVDAMTVLSLRQCVTIPVRDFFREILHLAPAARCADSIMTIYYNYYYRLLGVEHAQGQHIEAAFVFSTSPTQPMMLVDGRELRVRHIPAHEVAYSIHRGADNARHLAFQSLLRWVETHQYRVAAPLREIYLRRNGDDHITEVQIPIVRSEAEIEGFRTHYSFPYPHP